MNVKVFVDGVLYGQGLGVKSDDRNPSVIVTEPNGEQFTISCMPKVIVHETLSELTNDQKCDINELINQELSMLEDILEHDEYSSDAERKADEDRTDKLWQILRDL